MILFKAAFLGERVWLVQIAHCYPLSKEEKGILLTKTIYKVKGYSNFNQGAATTKRVNWHLEAGRRLSDHTVILPWRHLCSPSSHENFSMKVLPLDTSTQTGTLSLKTTLICFWILQDNGGFINLNPPTSSLKKKKCKRESKYIITNSYLQKYYNRQKSTNSKYMYK